MNYKKLSLIGGIALLFIGSVYGLSISKSIQDLSAYIQQIYLTSNGTPSGTANIVIDGANSKIGIGTSNPSHMLQVNGGDILGSNNIYIGGGVGIGTTSVNRDINILNTSQNAEIDIQSIAGNDNHFALYHHKDWDQFRIRGNGTDNFTIAQNGNIGIGTNSPNAKLDLAGDIKIGYTYDGCNSTNTGKVRTSGNSLQFCNGSLWQNLNLPVCGAGESLTYNGNTWVCGKQGTILRKSTYNSNCAINDATCRMNARNNYVNDATIGDEYRLKKNGTDDTSDDNTSWYSSCHINDLNDGSKVNSTYFDRCAGIICDKKGHDNHVADGVHCGNGAPVCPAMIFSIVCMY